MEFQDKVVEEQLYYPLCVVGSLKISFYFLTCSACLERTKVNRTIWEWISMKQENYDVQTETQIKIIDELSTISENIGAQFWLRGGWAIDFMLGKVTRPHSDIDIVTWITNREKLEFALLKAGYEQVLVGEEFRNRQSDFVKNDVVVTIVYLTYDVNGNLIMNGLPEWVWRDASLLPRSFQLHALKAKVLHPKQLLEEKIAYEEIGRPNRKKDEESKRILRQIISDFN